MSVAYIFCNHCKIVYAESILFSRRTFTYKIRAPLWARPLKPNLLQKKRFAVLDARPTSRSTVARSVWTGTLEPEPSAECGVRQSSITLERKIYSLTYEYRLVPAAKVFLSWFQRKRRNCCEPTNSIRRTLHTLCIRSVFILLLPNACSKHYDPLYRCQRPSTKWPRFRNGTIFWIEPFSPGKFCCS